MRRQRLQHRRDHSCDATKDRNWHHTLFHRRGEWKNRHPAHRRINQRRDGARTLKGNAHRDKPGQRAEQNPNENHPQQRTVGAGGQRASRNVEWQHEENGEQQLGPEQRGRFGEQFRRINAPSHNDENASKYQAVTPTRMGIECQSVGGVAPPDRK